MNPTYRKWYKTCGGHVFTEHPGLGLTDVYAAVIPGSPLSRRRPCPLCRTTLHAGDELPKMRDLPKEMGGSGLSVIE